MGRTYHASGTYDPTELKMLSGVYQDVCWRIVEDGQIALTTHVREAIAVGVFNSASSGVRDTERLWCHAMREVSTHHSVAAASP
jgi:hypothetical protein